MSAIPLRQIEGKYEILEKIREGGMGAIYKVRHRLLDEVRVIKLMRPQLTEDEELKERFLREARLAIKLRHPNIAQLYDFTVDDESGIAFIVMELIQGVTLEDLLSAHGPPPLGLALEIAQQSLRALGYLHTRGFVHRDISPDNLMLTEDAEGGPAVKLIDLGIAKVLGAPTEKNLTHTGTFLGKVRYASPEQFGFEGAVQVDPRGDLYSFGLVLYQLLTGHYPVQGRDPSSIMAGHLFRPPLDFQESDPRGRVPDGLRAVVLRALAKSPADRFPTAQEMSRAMAPFRQPGDVSEDELQRVLSPPAAPARNPPAPPPPVPGSTQQRLDEQFEMSTTPRPNPLTAVPPEPEPPVAEVVPTAVLQPKEDPLAGALRQIEAALEGGHAAEAETLLFEAEAAHGHHQAFASLYDRLEELQKRREEEKRQAVAARRQAALETAAAEIHGHLDRSEIAEAARRLDHAVLRFGGADVLRAEWERLEALQKAEREARKAVQRIAELLAQRDTAQALKELRAATSRFGEREELNSLRKRLADMVLG